MVLLPVIQPVHPFWLAIQRLRIKAWISKPFSLSHFFVAFLWKIKPAHWLRERGAEGAAAKQLCGSRQRATDLRVSYRQWNLYEPRVTTKWMGPSVPALLWRHLISAGGTHTYTLTLDTPGARTCSWKGPGGPMWRSLSLAFRTRSWIVNDTQKLWQPLSLSNHFSSEYCRNSSTGWFYWFIFLIRIAVCVWFNCKTLHHMLLMILMPQTFCFPPKEIQSILTHRRLNLKRRSIWLFGRLNWRCPMMLVVVL